MFATVKNKKLPFSLSLILLCHLVGCEISSKKNNAYENPHKDTIQPPDTSGGKDIEEPPPVDVDKVWLTINNRNLKNPSESKEVIATLKNLVKIKNEQERKRVLADIFSRTYTDANKNKELMYALIKDTNIDRELAQALIEYGAPVDVVFREVDAEEKLLSLVFDHDHLDSFIKDIQRWKGKHLQIINKWIVDHGRIEVFERIFASNEFTKTDKTDIKTEVLAQAVSYDLDGILQKGKSGFNRFELFLLDASHNPRVNIRGVDFGYVEGDREYRANLARMLLRSVLSDFLFKHNSFLQAWHDARNKPFSAQLKKDIAEKSAALKVIIQPLMAIIKRAGQFSEQEWKEYINQKSYSTEGAIGSSALEVLTQGFPVSEQDAKKWLLVR